MRLTTFTLLILLIVNCGCCQSTGKRYRSHVGNGGTSYFFVPKKLSNKTGIDKFEFDMTHLSSTDSVTLNFTVILKQPVTVKSMSLKNDKCDVEAPYLSMLYRDVLDDGYEIRTTSRFLLTDIQKFFNEESPLYFDIKLSDGNEVSATYSKSQWKKERDIVTRILNSIILLQ